MATFEPRILGFLCNWCSYAGADLAGVSRFQYAPNLRVIRVMCSARVDPLFVLRALRRGLDGVMVLGCHFGDCHYITGNYRCRDRMQMTRKLLEMGGIHPDRLYVDWVSAAEGRQFADLVDQFAGGIRALGPLGVAEERDADQLKGELDALMKVLSGERVRWLIGQQMRLVEEENVYGEKLSSEEFDRLMTECVREEYLSGRIARTVQEGPLSVKEIAARIGLPPGEVLTQITVLKREGQVGLADMQGKSPRYVAVG